MGLIYIFGQCLIYAWTRVAKISYQISISSRTTGIKSPPYKATMLYQSRIHGVTRETSTHPRIISKTPRSSPLDMDPDTQGATTIMHVYHQDSSM